MNDIALHSGLHQTSNLETILQAMCAYGRPRLTLTSIGWYCVVDMNTNAAGASFEVRSEMRHTKAIDAASECFGRMTAAAKIAGTAIARLT